MRSAADFGLATRENEGAVRLRRRQRIGGTLVALALLGAGASFAANGTPAQAKQPSLFGGAVVLNDTHDPVVLDLATGQPALQLVGVTTEVGAPSASSSQVSVVPVQGGTLLLDNLTGSFNFLGQGGVLVKTTGGGVGLPPHAGTTSAAAFAAGPDAYIVRYAPHSAEIDLVSEATVQIAAELTSNAASKHTAVNRPVQLLGAATAGGSIANQASAPYLEGQVVTANGNLFALVDTGHATRLVEIAQVRGDKLSRSDATQLARGTVAALNSGPVRPANKTQGVALATPGGIETFVPGRRTRSATVPGSAATTTIVPVGNSAGDLWFIYQSGQATDRLVGVDLATGALVGAPLALANVPQGTFRSPVLAADAIYALVDDGSPTPPLVVVDPSTGKVAPLPGVPTYPRNKVESPTFRTPEILAIGPRVIFNNPDSDFAVVVFTDGSAPPLKVDKESKATPKIDPGALGATVSVKNVHSATTTTTAHSQGSTPTSTATTIPSTATSTSLPPVVAPQRVTVLQSCSNTKQKPHEPQMLPAVPATNSVQLSWSYPLLTSEDCEPTSYVVTATAQGGGPTPAQTSFVVNGGTTFDFPGLRSSTTYLFVVSAYIGKASTQSAPLAVTTEAEGPDAPTSVTTSADGATGWTVSWTTCAPDQCKSADTVAEWRIIGTACGGSDVSSPPMLDVPGGAQSTQTAQSAQVSFSSYPGLVGDQMSFQVQGIGADGLVGNPTQDGSCTQGWRAPNSSLISLQAGGTAGPNASVTANLSVVTSGDPTQAFGSASTIASDVAASGSPAITKVTSAARR